MFSSSRPTSRPWPTLPSPSRPPFKTHHPFILLLPKLSTPSDPSPSSPSSSSSAAAAGSVRRLVLTPEGRTKLNTLPDREFYSFPRFVTHVDDGFIAALTELYRERLRPGPTVVGHGLNAQELARNPRLDHFFVKDLNRDHHLQLHAQSFDAVLCAVSVQYLQSPEKVFAEVFRVLKPGSVEGFTQPEVVKKLPVKADDDQTPLRGIMRLLGFSRSDPFYAVISYRNFKSTNEMQ
uniref:Methyltransferase type 11 domain-containing protein n=1 Tax=Ananas comosus var. bracteatus TaxID=296719 RepID=A0A6V7Q0E5_ANACO|nr:unnamed protein product [Ananas comosus var. bracteatus]